MRLTYFLLMAGLFIFYGCSKDVEPLVLSRPAGCDSAGFSYSKNVKPVIIANCSGPTCHSGGNANYDFRTYEVIADRIRSGSFEDRLLLATDDPLYMPQGKIFGTCDLFTVRAWIHQGFKNN